MMETTQIEIWVLVDENGDYVTAYDEEELGSNYDSIFGTPPGALRKIRIVLNVPSIKPVELTGTVPAESTEGITLEVK